MSIFAIVFIFDFQIVKDLIPFLFIVFIVSVAFGLADLALLNKNIQLSWTLAEHAIMKQYWILHGDNSVDDFDIGMGDSK